MVHAGGGSIAFLAAVGKVLWIKQHAVSDAVVIPPCEARGYAPAGFAHPREEDGAPADAVHEFREEDVFVVLLPGYVRPDYDMPAGGTDEDVHLKS